MALKLPWVAKYLVEPGVPIPGSFSSSSQGRSRGLSGDEKNMDDKRDKDDWDNDDKRITSDLQWDSTRRTAFSFWPPSRFTTRLLVRHRFCPPRSILLRQLFHKVDRDQDGKLSVTELDKAVSSPNLSSSVKQNFRQMKNYNWISDPFRDF